MGIPPEEFVISLTPEKEQELKNPTATTAGTEQAAASTDQAKSLEKAPETPAKQANPKEKEFVSKGYKIHNELTYRGIDWLLNSAVGVSCAYWTAKTENGKKIFSKVSGFYDRLLKPIIKNESTRKVGAKGGTMFTSIMMGGFAIIPPMMWMEKKENKKKIVKWLDEKTYGKETVANDPKFAEQYERIEEEPHKSLMGGIGSRLLALAPLLVITFTNPIHSKLVQYIYEPIGKVSKGGAKLLRLEPKPDSKMFIEGAEQHIHESSKKPMEWVNNWEFLHKTIGFDVGLTFVYAILHEVAYKRIAAIGWKKKDKNAAAEGTTQTDASVSTSPSVTPDAPAIASEPVKAEEKSFAQTVQHSKRPEKSGDLFVEQLAAKQETGPLQPSI